MRNLDERIADAAAELAAARAHLDSAKVAAIAVAKEAHAAGVSEVELAGLLGVDRARTLRRWLGKAVPIIVAAVALSTLAAPPARADDGDSVSQTICTASRLGEYPSQIAAQLQAGDARWNLLRGTEKVYETLIVDGCN